ncbi:MAG TPA: DUF1080 domain-containing protein [Opitutaceae bacterium]|nr:DUF1080 domain-containing protein [Opitutaceae bacterium]
MPHPLRFCLALLTGLLAGGLRASDATTESGFVSLFNGKDLTGWHHKDGPPLDGKTDPMDGRWSVHDGLLTVNAEKERVLLWTTRDFPKNFVLRLEFRASVRADSGIFFDNVQLQCGDFQTYAYKQLKSFKPQDWNAMEITVHDGSAFCTCNGEILETALKVPPLFGQLALEAGRNAIEYRNIRLKELP